MRLALLLFPLAALLGSCFDDTSCSVTEEDDGSATITCPDGSTATVAPGSDGQDGTDGQDGDDGATALIRIEDEPPGEHCPDGGQAVHTGLDTDGDGVLDDDEITDTAYVCDGAPGISTVARLDDVPPGDRCPAGGVALHVGPDLDGDGALQDDEIVATRWICDGTVDAVSLVRLDALGPTAACPAGGYEVHVGIDEDGDGALEDDEIQATETVCHGSDGDDGADGLHSVARIDAEPPGAHCAAGGLAVHVGTDDDGDGALDDDEIDETAWLCDGEDGADGADALVRVDDEPAGAACQRGGLAVHAGRDLDGDGTLDDDEIEHTSYLCEPRTHLQPGRTDLVARWKGWSARCLRWDGAVCTLAQVRVDCSTCDRYEDCGAWHDLTAFNNGGDRTTTNFCGLATGDRRFVSWTESEEWASTPTACGSSTSGHPICTTGQATSGWANDFGITGIFALNLQTTYCLSGNLMHLQCSGW